MKRNTSHSSGTLVVPNLRPNDPTKMHNQLPPPLSLKPVVSLQCPILAPVPIKHPISAPLPISPLPARPPQPSSITPIVKWPDSTLASNATIIPTANETSNTTTIPPHFSIKKPACTHGPYAYYSWPCGNFWYTMAVICSFWIAINLVATTLACAIAYVSEKRDRPDMSEMPRGLSRGGMGGLDRPPTYQERDPLAPAGSGGDYRLFGHTWTEKTPAYQGNDKAAGLPRRWDEKTPAYRARESNVVYPAYEGRRRDEKTPTRDEVDFDEYDLSLRVSFGSAEVQKGVYD
ncbi:hypothetical protein BT63DRAFT_415279 [Microthyrium microscopicum]|uniref:Uncharacterized protein n=1 Tax=Microthyrium microscopicum TaxID=703497 RepID=A0A6A6U721_9PEZI|nr:hypothetical protein BT63DRAFT_415279 [Microthyrium microscopicum]